VETQAKILQSESLLERVIDKLNLDQEQPATGWRGFASRVQRMFAWSKTSQVAKKQELIRQAARNLTVRASGNSRLLEVMYESPDPKQAADFANTLVSDHRTKPRDAVEVHAAHRRMADEPSGRDEDQAGTVGGQLKIRAQLRAVVYLGEGKLIGEPAQEIQDELSKAQADRIANQSKFEEAKSKPADPCRRCWKTRQCVSTARS